MAFFAGILFTIIIVVIFKFLLSTKAKRSDSSSFLPQPFPDSANKINEILDPDNRDYRREFKNFLINSPLFRSSEEILDMKMDEIRDLTFKRLKLVVDNGFVKSKDITENTQRFIAAHEIFSLIDPSSIYFLSVQFNLFAGSILKLGTEKHHQKYLSDIDKLNLPGCFALTEVGHGVNSGFFMRTTAIYDVSSQTFTINTPSRLAAKNWISFSAKFAKLAVVFASLKIRNTTGDGEDLGVHAFLVPLRKDDGSLEDGVEIEDMGHKPTLNGNDNGRILLKNIKIPRDNLLNRFSDISPEGNYTSSIDKVRERFLRVADQLVSGRCCIASASITLAKICLVGAIRFSISRKQSNLSNKEVNLFSHLTQRRELLTRVATSMALNITMNHVKLAYATINQSNREEVIEKVCGMKAYNTWFSVDATTVCREKTGGQGLLSVNQMGDMSNVAASLVVVEGDCMLLIQKVAKSLMDDFRKESTKDGVLKGFIANKIHTLSANFDILKKSLTEGSSILSNFEFLEQMFKLRVHLLKNELGMKLYEEKKKNNDVFEAWSKKYLDLVVHLGTSHCELFTFLRCLEVYNIQKDKYGASNEMVQVLRWVIVLFSLWKIEKDLGFFLTHTSLPSSIAESIPRFINDLVINTTDQQALMLVEGFDFPDALLRADIATGKWLKDLA